MTNAEIEKELHFVKRVLDDIRMVETPKLTYEEEKQVVRKALLDYQRKLESAQYGY